MELSQKKSKPPNDSILPGLEKWYEAANDYEKEVVHKFFNNVAKSTDNHNESLLEEVNTTFRKSPRLSPDGRVSRSNKDGYSEFPLRPHSSNSIVTLDPNIDIKKSVRIKSAPIIGYSEGISRRIATPGTLPKNDTNNFEKVETDIGMENARINSPNHSRASSSRSNSSRASSVGSIEHKSVTTQIPYKFGSKPSSPLYKDSFSKSKSDFSHKCQKCQTCREKEVKSILEELKGVGPKSYEQLRLEKVYPEEDYNYTGTSFQKVNGVRRNFFIIHPDFVSENRGRQLLEKRRLAKKYFGESKVGC